MVTRTVSLGPAVGIPSLNGAGVAATSGSSDYVYVIACREYVAFDLAAHGVRGAIRETELFHILPGSDARLFELTCGGLVDVLFFHGAETDFDLGSYRVFYLKSLYSL